MTDPFDVEVDAHVDTHENEGVYADEEQAEARGKQLRFVRGDSSDEVDPRKLYRDPTLSEIRWYYRRTFASILVDKPIEDAFKNSFEFVGDNADEAQNLLERPRYGRDEKFVDAYIDAQIKARRDGFALLFIGTEDDSAGIHVSPIDENVTVSDITHVKVLRIDDLTHSTAHDQIQEGTGLEQGQYDVRKTGLVVNTDITSSHYREPVGYMLEGADDGQFIHADRVLHYTWNENVDGDYKDDHRHRPTRFHGNSTLGKYEGDSVLIPSYDIMKGISKANWALAQTIFRGASHLYTVTLPEDADEEDLDHALHTTQNINAKSALVWPHGYEDQQHESGNEMDPSPHYEALFNQVCAVHEMTKSVLFGTQAGTVSGSEVDIKNYFNKVERFRTTRATDDIDQYLTQAKRMLDGRTADDFEFTADIEWGPLFKVDNETRLKMLQTQAQAIGTLIGQYVITPDEARELLNEEWAQVDYSSLTEDQMDVLDRINLAQVGRGEWSEANDPSPETVAGGETAESGGEQGGRPAGAGNQQSETSGTTPTT